MTCKATNRFSLAFRASPIASVGTAGVITNREHFATLFEEYARTTRFAKAA